MGDRAAKLRKLNDFRRRLPHCSASALSAIISDVRKHGLPEGGIGRNRLREARDLQNSDPTPFGPILQTAVVIDKGDVEQHLTIAHPLALLWVASSDSSSFSAFLQQKLKDHPPSLEKPWNLVIYTDEVTPGNPLATLNKRKFHALYWSFLEFGVNALSKEESWFCAITEYSVLVSAFHAGLSQVVAVVLKQFFSEGVNLASTGMLLPFGGRLWAKLGGVLQDGGAHKSVWHARGDGASKFCLLCKNLFHEKSGIIDEDGTNLMACNVLKWKDLVPASSMDLRRNARYLANKEGTMSAEAFIDLQQSLGQTHHKHSLLLDTYLDAYIDPVAVYQHDWMHALFVDGVFNTILYLLLEAFIQGGCKDVYEVYSQYISNWSWPDHILSAHLPAIFSHDRRGKHRAAKHIKCQASDGLSLTGVTAMFVVKVLLKLKGMHVMQKDCSKECYAFLALVDVIDLIQVSSGIKLQPERLLGAAEHFLDLFKDAWGCKMMVPKFHWLLHLHKQLKLNGKLLNCFCLERKHRVAKRYAGELSNISKQNSRSLLMEVTSHHLGQLNHPHCFDFGVGLVLSLIHI